MAKILCNYFGLSMAAEGKSEFVGGQAAAFLGYVQQDAERCAENCGCAEDLSDAPEEIKREILRNDEELRRREQTAPGVEHGQAALGGHDGLRLCLGVNAVCDCLIDDDLVVSHGENLQNIFY